jgi:hypothetical protein
VTARAAGRPGLRISARGRRILRPVLAVAAIASVVQALIAFVVLPLTNRFTGQFEDFPPYYEAARDVTRGAGPYLGFDAGPHNMTMSGYDYPPLVAWLLQPLAHFSQHDAAVLWLWLGLACTLASAVIIALTVLPARWPRVQLAIVAALSFAPATYNLWHGQFNPLLLLVLALAFRAYVTDSELACGVLLGVGASLKIAPLVLAVLLLRRRWWRGLAGMALAGAGGLVAGTALLGPGVTREFFATVLPALSRQNGWLYNESWGGMVNRAFSHSVLVFDATSTTVASVTVVLVAASLGLVWWATQERDRTREERGGEFGLGVAAMLMVGTVTWYPHETHLLITLAAAAALIRCRRGAAAKWLVAGVLAAVAGTGVVAPVLIEASPWPVILERHDSRGWYAFIQLWSLPALTTAALMVALAVGLRAVRTGDGSVTSTSRPE